MKILFECRSIIPDKSGGIENYTYMLINGWLKTFPTDNILIHIPPGTESKYRLKIKGDVTYLEEPLYRFIKKYFLSNYFLKYIPILFAKNSRYFRRTLFGLKKKWITEIDENVDWIIYTFQREIFAHDPQKSLVVMHDFREWDDENGDLEMRKNQKTGLENCARIVVSWPYPYARLVDLFPNLANKTIQVPFLYDPFDDCEPTNYIDPKYLYYPSANAKHKNHEGLIRGLSAYNKQNPQKKMKAICTGPIDPERQKLLNHLMIEKGVINDIKFYGFVSREKVHELYKNCFAVITTTKYEAFSGAILEAYRFKKPVIASNIRPITDFLDTFNLNLTLFDPENELSICESIEELDSKYLQNAIFSIEGYNKLKDLNPQATSSQIRKSLE